jgi:hypothetical protein
MAIVDFHRQRDNQALDGGHVGSAAPHQVLGDRPDHMGQQAFDLVEHLRGDGRRLHRASGDRRRRGLHRFSNAAFEQGRDAFVQLAEVEVEAPIERIEPMLGADEIFEALRQRHVLDSERQHVQALVDGALDFAPDLRR